MSVLHCNDDDDDDDDNDSDGNVYNDIDVELDWLFDYYFITITLNRYLL